MIRVSPSLLESYRLYLTGEWMSTEMLVEKITSKFQPTPEILLGWAYHHLIEQHTDLHEMYIQYGNPSEHEMRAVSDGFTFAYESVIEPVVDWLRVSPVHEVYGTRELLTQYGPVSVATKADAVHGIQGAEWKTTGKAIDIQRYMDSVQWKLCAWALHLTTMDYRVLKLKQRKDGIWYADDHQAVQLVFTDSLMDEVIDLIHGLIDFHHQQGLQDFLLPYHDRPPTKEEATHDPEN